MVQFQVTLSDPQLLLKVMIFFNPKMIQDSAIVYLQWQSDRKS